MHGYGVACIVVLERERVPVLSGGASEYHQPQMGCSPPTSPLLNRLVFVRQLFVEVRRPARGGAPQVCLCPGKPGALGYKVITRQMEATVAGT